MKKNALVAIGLLFSLGVTGVVSGQNNSDQDSIAAVRVIESVTVEQARKAALKKVDGTIEDEYTIEDEDEKLVAYVFVIKAKKDGKMFEVQVDAAKGNVISTEEIVEEEVEEDDPVSEVVETDDTEEAPETEQPETEEEDEPPFSIS